VGDGLLIADPDGRITFANRSAGAILGVPARGLVGQNLTQRLSGWVDAETLARLTAEHGHFEREIAIRGLRTLQYTLRLAAVSADEKAAGPVLGIVASLSDVTRQYELQQTKNDVISLVSHEMRTPLTAIQGMTELLAAYDVEPVRRREMNLAINDEVKRLTRMITGYLDITRLESGATAMRLSPVRAETLLERILILVEPVAAQRQIRVEGNFPSDLPPFLADADLLSRAVENLVSNAIKYSPDGTTVSVLARAEEDYVAIEVADHGYGIPQADLERVFEKFYRVPRVQDAGVPGTGLGLALVREIAELHHGSVAVRSEVNQGSIFTLRIPRNEVRKEA
jgi:two-component system phosphate regulon sensor histidine kinase PhoR